MQHFDTGNEDTRKPKVDAATQEKKEAERKLFEQHAADYYLREFDKDNTNYWRRLDDIEVTEEKQVPEDPNGSTLHASRTERTTPLFFKEGIYENKKGALIKLSQDGKIFLGKGASFEDGIDFALRGQGAFTKGIEYDVGSIALGTQSTAYLDFKNRLKNIQKGFDLGEKQGFAFTLSDDTKKWLLLLLENKKISQKEYDSILQREITVELSAQNRQNEFLKKVTENEIKQASIAKIADPTALKAELEKTDPNNKEMDTEPKAVLKHADEKIGKIQQHAELLERVANNVDQQVNQLKQQLEDKAKYDGAQNDTTIPPEERDRYKAQSAGIEEGIKGNKWLSNHEEQLKSLDHHGENIKNLIENAKATLAVVDATLNENKQTKLKKAADEAEKKYNTTDKAAKDLLADIDKYNKDTVIDLNSTKLSDIQAKLKDTSITVDALNTAKIIKDSDNALNQQASELIAKVNDYNTKNPTGKIDLKTATLDDLKNKLSNNDITDDMLKIAKAKGDITSEAKKLITAIDQHNLKEAISIPTMTAVIAKDKLGRAEDIAPETLTAAKDIERQKTEPDHELSHKRAYDSAKKALEDFQKNDATTVPDANQRAENKTAKEEHAKLTALQTKLTEAINGSKPNQKGDIERPGLVQKQEKLKEQEENIRKVAAKLAQDHQSNLRITATPTK